jgi:hypothetical protein
MLDVHTSIPEGVLMGFLIFLTAVAQVFLRHTFQRKYLRMPFTTIELTSSRCKAVVDYLPMSLFTKALAKKYHNHDPDPAHEMNMELFSKDRTCYFFAYAWAWLNMLLRGPKHCPPEVATEEPELSWGSERVL